MDVTTNKQALIAWLIDDDDDDDGDDCLSFVTTVMGHIAKTFIRNPRVRIIGYVEDVIPRYSNEEFRRVFRLSRQTFITLCEYLKQCQELSVNGAGGREPIVVEKQLTWELQILFIELQTDLGFLNLLSYCHETVQQSSLWDNGLRLCNGNHLVADAAYPLRRWLLTPYRDNGHLNQEQKHFNYMHSSNRVVIERLFGLLKGRYRRLYHIDSKQFDVFVPFDIWLQKEFDMNAIVHYMFNMTGLHTSNGDKAQSAANFSPKKSDPLKNCNKKKHIAAKLLCISIECTWKKHQTLLSEHLAYDNGNTSLQCIYEKVKENSIIQNKDHEQISLKLVAHLITVLFKNTLSDTPTHQFLLYSDFKCNQAIPQNIF
ncbi:hypothetical protein KUTeg_022368 [Tegillarca granosa]|uniref:DDE Tnp4 domain-containing protein n=1 Tax=Tegillarca granosa TaxID=220873 RepID=A0ABQ9E673_TEGGR|nr:hypothetical protein KUTeg_022368 [Tegillarca granosa]